MALTKGIQLLHYGQLWIYHSSDIGGSGSLHYGTSFGLHQSNYHSEQACGLVVDHVKILAF
jgi:hypothetical protein